MSLCDCTDACGTQTLALPHCRGRATHANTGSLGVGRPTMGIVRAARFRLCALPCAEARGSRGGPVPLIPTELN